MLLVAAVMGIGISSAMVVERMVDDRAAVPVDPVQSVIEAQLQASQIEREADTLIHVNRWRSLNANTGAEGDNAKLRARCKQIKHDFPDVFGDRNREFGWDPPEKAKLAEDDPNTSELEEGYEPPVLARCKVRFPNTGSG